MTTAQALQPQVNPDTREETVAPPGPGFSDASLSKIADHRLDDLAQVIRAYNTVTENLQRSHDALQKQVESLQQRLASADEQLQRSRRLAALGEMAAGIAHEIRNPLGAIQLYAGMLRDDLENHIRSSPIGPSLAEAAENARKIASAVRGLDAIVGDVLTFSREIAPSLATTSVARLFDRALEAMGPSLDYFEVVIEKASTLETMHAKIDSDLIHQALVNILRNAAQAMAEKSGAGVGASFATRNKPHTITLGARVEGPAVVLAIRDTGPGIAEQDIDRIFNPFFTTRNTGTGLGLAIVHRIIDAHGGTVTVHNDSGAVFELRLPINGVAAGKLIKPAAQDEPVSATARTKKMPNAASSGWTP